MRIFRPALFIILSTLVLISSASCAKKTEKKAVQKTATADTTEAARKKLEKSFNLDVSTYLSAREAFALAEAELKKLGKQYRLFTVVAASPVDSFMEKDGKSNHWVLAFYFPGVEPVVAGKTKTINITIDRRYKNKFGIGQGYYEDKIVDDKGKPYDIPGSWKDSTEIMDIIAKNGGDNFIQSNFTEAAFPSVNALHCKYRIQASLAGNEWRVLMNAGKSNDPKYLVYLKAIIGASNGKVNLISVNK